MNRLIRSLTDEFKTEEEKRVADFFATHPAPPGKRVITQGLETIRSNREIFTEQGAGGFSEAALKFPRASLVLQRSFGRPFLAVRQKNAQRGGGELPKNRESFKIFGIFRFLFKCVRKPRIGAWPRCPGSREERRFHGSGRLLGFGVVQSSVSAAASRS